ncbi:MAG: DNA gyrase subunit A [Verrucomicrobiota bacterium]
MYTQNERVLPINVAEEMQKSFLDYSMSVIISRALPDARDGLKPSQRRILYAMHDLSLYPGKKHIKCAKICGDTSGNYHPHGEAVVYPTLVNMAQWWGLRCPLVDGKGNFGSMDGDPPAAMRYTEARMTALGASLLNDIDKDTVDFVPNYDERLTEPVVFPAAFPNLLVNGCTGIAVGMATNMATHNLGEVIDAVCAQIDNPDITIKELLKIIPGPDFSTGGILCGTAPIEQYFRTGRGSLKLRGRIGVEEGRSGKEQLVITEVPYNTNPEELIKQIADLVENKKLDDITDVRNESDESLRLVVELKRDAIAKVVIANLYKYTGLEVSFSVNALALDHRRPKVLPLKELMNCFIEHRREVIIRRTKFELRKAEDRAHILEGYKIALDHLDDFVKIIRGSANRDEAKEKLQKKYALSDRQVNAILDLRLYQLTGLEREKIEKEYLEIIQLIEELRSILASERKVLSIVKNELKEIKDKYADPRRTQIVPDEGEINIEDLIANEGCIITITHAGYIKRTAVSSYRAQRRGGKGVIGMVPKESDNGVAVDEQDFVEHLFTASTHDYLMFFTNKGRLYVEKVYEIPEMGRAAKGKSLANVLQMQPGENIAALICAQDFSEQKHLVMATASGIVKKTNLAEYSNFRKGGIIAIKIEEGDQLIGVSLTEGKNEVVLVTHEGLSIRFHEDQLRDQGRSTVGVYGIRPRKDDRVVAMAIVSPEATLLVAGENGIGKRTGFEEYRVQSRGGKGIITMKTTEKTGGVAGALAVRDSDEIMLITFKGQMVRIAVKGIREAGRNTQGVKLVNLEQGDRLQAIAPVISSEAEDAAESEEKE